MNYFHNKCIEFVTFESNFHDTKSDEQVRNCIWGMSRTCKLRTALMNDNSKEFKRIHYKTIIYKSTKRILHWHHAKLLSNSRHECHKIYDNNTS